MTEPDPRDLEWQRRYEQNDTPWDRGAAAPPLVSYLHSGTIVGRVLVLGCGRGHEVRALAEHPDCSPVGLDLSPIAIADARRLAAEASLENSARFVVGDFFDLSPEMKGSFDWLVEHTCFCAIDPRQRPAYVLAAASALRAGGKIFAIFYLQPDVEGGPPFAVSKEELYALFDPHFDLLEEWVPEETFPGREKRELVRILRKR